MGGWGGGGPRCDREGVRCASSGAPTAPDLTALCAPTVRCQRGRQASPCRGQSLREQPRGIAPPGAAWGDAAFPGGKVEVEALPENHFVHSPSAILQMEKLRPVAAEAVLEGPCPSLSSADRAGCLRLLVALFIVGLCVGCVPGCLFMGEDACIQSAGGGGRQLLSELSSSLCNYSYCAPKVMGTP